jgi:hypothetical protein
MIPYWNVNAGCVNDAKNSCIEGRTKRHSRHTASSSYNGPCIVASILGTAPGMKYVGG